LQLTAFGTTGAGRFGSVEIYDNSRLCGNTRKYEELQWKPRRAGQCVACD
jgi:hypothetical protein